MQLTQVIAVIVVFQPNLEILRQLILTCSLQVDQVLIVNNSPEIPLEECLSDLGDHIHLIELLENMGIAYAQNIGIEWAISQKAEYVLLLDQDSMPTKGMVQALIECLKSDSRAIVSGASYKDPRTDLVSKFIVSRFGLPMRRSPSKNSVSIYAHTLISSGMLIRLDFLQKIGGMRSSYFIDSVDTEWCLRAIAKGYVLLGSNHAFMEHTIGHSTKKIWFLYTRNISIHSPLRHYYILRNLMLMVRDTPMNVAWALSYFYRVAQFFIFFSLFSVHPGDAKMMWLGIKHGFQNQRGRLDLVTYHCVPIPTTCLDPATP